MSISWQLATFATSFVKIFSSKFGAPEVCIAPQVGIAITGVYIVFSGYSAPVETPQPNLKSILSKNKLCRNANLMRSKFSAENFSAVKT